MGAPVMKDGITPTIDTPIRLLRTEPEKLLDYLKGTSGSTHMIGVPSHLLRPNTLELHDLQARLYMRPEVMLDEKLVQIKSYWRFDTPPKAYMQQIKGLVNEGLSTWLMQGRPADEDAFAPDTKALGTLTKVVHKGVTGAEAPKAPPMTLGQQFVSLILSQRREAAARILENHYESFQQETFVVPPDKKGQGGGTYDLAGFIKCFQNPKCIQIAFNKGLFPGGQRAYSFFEKIKEYPFEVYDFLDQLQNFKDPAKTLELFEDHFQDTPIQDSLKLLSSLNTIGNDTSVIDTARPLMAILDAFPDNILKGVAALQARTRPKICIETASVLQGILSDAPSPLSEKVQLNLYIKELLGFVQSIQGLSPEQKTTLWSLAKTMDTDWDFRCRALDILRHVDWKEVPPSGYPRPLSAPFSAQDVIDHAKTKPEIYEMTFLKSTPGKIVIQTLIDHINKGLLPIRSSNQKYPFIVSAWNKTHPWAGYNKSLIAHYISELKQGHEW